MGHLVVETVEQKIKQRSHVQTARETAEGFDIYSYASPFVSRFFFHLPFYSLYIPSNEEITSTPTLKTEVLSIAVGALVSRDQF